MILFSLDFNAHLFFVRGVCIFHRICLNHAILQGDAFCNLGKVGSGDIFVGCDVINFLLQEFRVSQFCSQFSVVGEEKNPRGVSVETSDRIDAFATGMLHQIHHRFAVLRVFAGGHISFGFVQEDIDFLFHFHGIVVETNLVGSEELGSKSGDDFSVHYHQTRNNLFDGIATRANACIGKEFVQANGLCGIVVLFFIFISFFEVSVFIESGVRATHRSSSGKTGVSLVVA